MVQITQLRIGNLVEAACGIGKVLGITTEGILIEGKDCTDLFAEKYVEPVLLNEDWLLKFGFLKPIFRPESDTDYNNDYEFECVNMNGFKIFKKEEFYIGSKKDKFYVVYEGAGYDEEAHIYSFGTDFRFVHELQNLCFFLTGEELTLNT